jgi:Ni,Fe-hydrogenase III small subunit/NAD-dependent dihydropyrimidine dehydrogenase PreA subunit
MICEVQVFKLLNYILSNACTTQKNLFPDLEEYARGLPTIDNNVLCDGNECTKYVALCPTSAINFDDVGNGSLLTLDRGLCIGCGLCIDNCSSGIIANDRTTKTAVLNRTDLVLSNKIDTLSKKSKDNSRSIFSKSIAIRIVSTGCSACDLEISAAFNPIFDAERFGINLVASPRMADALVVTGPVGRGMHEALRRTYYAMPEPRLVIAAGTCAISGGVHANGYCEANGVTKVLPVDVFIPGCPPHPWSIIHGIVEAMKLSGR